MFMVIADGSVASVDNTGLAAQQITLAQALDNVYERRRIAWIKMRFIPRYTSFIQAVGVSDGEGAITAEVPLFANIPVYVVHDSNGLNGAVNALDTNAVTALLANTTGVKIKKLNRAFKVFRRSRKFPYAPKYMTANAVGNDNDTTPTNQAHISPSGMWLSTQINDLNAGVTQHTWVVSEPLPNAYAAGLQLFTCVYEIKYQWADKRSSYQ